MNLSTLERRFYHPHVPYFLFSPKIALILFGLGSRKSTKLLSDETFKKSGNYGQNRIARILRVQTHDWNELIFEKPRL
jgi:hypothetical protein